MKKPVWRCLTNPTNFVGTGRFKESKYKRVECGFCLGHGKHFDSRGDDHLKCPDCRGTGKISKRVSV